MDPSKVHEANFYSAEATIILFSISALLLTYCKETEYAANKSWLSHLSIYTLQNITYYYYPGMFEK